MLVREIVERYKKKRPISLMARMALARLLAPQSVDQVFHDYAREQYERKIPFAALTELMADVTWCLSPSVNAGYKKLKARLGASRSCVFGKLERVEPQVARPGPLLVCASPGDLQPDADVERRRCPGISHEDPRRQPSRRHGTSPEGNAKRTRSGVAG